MSFANNFWGRDDAGVEPLISRMHNAKQTCDELKSFYTGMFTAMFVYYWWLTPRQLDLLSKMSMRASYFHWLGNLWAHKNLEHYEHP